VLADVLRGPIDFDKIPAGPLRELFRTSSTKFAAG